MGKNKKAKTGTLVVVGEVKLAERAAQLVPSLQVVGASDDVELSDPATSLARIGTMLESGQTPAAVLCSGNPGFSVLTQLRRFPPSRCYVFPGESPWPLATLQCLVEASGMTLLQNLESLPVALGGRTVDGVRRPGHKEIPTASGLEADAAVNRLKAAQASAAERPAPAPKRQLPPEDFGWADNSPVQVPPAPVSLEPEGEASPPTVVEAGEAPPASRSAYLPTDLLRPLRPRRG
ncbi:MAG: hypothetical protein ACREN4_00495 [Candidatus Dormibacteria bacterium]